MADTTSPADLYTAGLFALQAGDLRAVEAFLRLLAPLDLVRAWDLLELTRVAVAIGYPDANSIGEHRDQRRDV